MRPAHHDLIPCHSDNAHAHLGDIIWDIPDPLLRQCSDAHMLLIILQVAFLGGDVVRALSALTVRRLK